MIHIIKGMSDLELYISFVPMFLTQFLGKKLAAVEDLLLVTKCDSEKRHDCRVSRRVMLTYKEIYISTLIHI